MTSESRTPGHGSGLDRRTFLQLSAIGGATFATASVTACQSGRRTGEKPAAANVPAFELDEITIAELSEGMESGRFTARSLCEMYLDRIEQLDHAGPSLHAMLDLNPDALDIAAQLGRERADAGVRGPLHGIPVIVKDNIGTADRMTTTAGSYALEGSIPSRDAFVARRLREAGAIILGKANLSEWANFRSTNSSSGWSGRGRQCRNPYALDRSPCGSSSGTAAAIAANYAAVGIGTETDGSVVCPSAANGLVGIKPTVGLVSRSGIVPIAHSQDTAGPMARTVRDAAILLGTMVGIDPEDRATKTHAGRGVSDYTKFLDADGLRGARIGVARKRYFGYSTYADDVVEEAVRRMSLLGADIIDPADIDTAGDWSDAEFDVLLYEFKADLNAYLESLGPSAPVKSLAEIIAFNERNRDREMPFFGQEIMTMAQEKGPLTDPAYATALEKSRRLTRSEGIDAVMARHNLDALIAPTGSPAWTIDLINGDHFLGSSSSPAAVSGYPNITVPAGEAFGLPIGISFFGREFSEPKLLRLAYAFEQATGARAAPGFKASV
ncbi:MAG: amidase [Gemmatimonadales bacterium]